MEFSDQTEKINPGDKHMRVFHEKLMSRREISCNNKREESFRTQIQCSKGGFEE